MVVFSDVPDRGHNMCQINMEGGALDHCGAFYGLGNLRIVLCDSPRWEKVSPMEEQKTCSRLLSSKVSQWQSQGLGLGLLILKLADPYSSDTQFLHHLQPA